MIMKNSLLATELIESLNENDRIMCTLADRIHVLLKEMYLRNIQIQVILLKEVERMILALVSRD